MRKVQVYAGETKQMSKMDKWKAITGKCFTDFVLKQSELHPEIRISVLAMSHIYWHELVGITKKFNEITNDEMDKLYQKARWLVECDYIKVFQCQKCNKAYYYVDLNDVKDVQYWDMVVAKNKLHILNGGVGNYGSEYDMEKIELNLCERCYGEIKGRIA